MANSISRSPISLVCLFHFLFNIVAFVFPAPWQSNILSCKLLVSPDLHSSGGIAVRWPAIFIVLFSVDITRLEVHKVSQIRARTIELFPVLLIMSSFKCPPLLFVSHCSHRHPRLEIQSCFSPCTFCSNLGDTISKGYVTPVMYKPNTCSLLCWDASLFRSYLTFSPIKLLPTVTQTPINFCGPQPVVWIRNNHTVEFHHLHK